MCEVVWYEHDWDDDDDGVGGAVRRRQTKIRIFVVVDYSIAEITARFPDAV